MKKYFYILLISSILLFGAQPDVRVLRSDVNVQNDNTRNLRNGEFGLVCQNELGTYNPNMLNYLYSPVISVPEGESVNVDFLLKGTFLDNDADNPNASLADLEYFGFQVRTLPSTPNWFDDDGWSYISNPYADTATVDIDFNDDGVIDEINDILVGDPYPPHYVYTSADPEFFNLFSSSFNDGDAYDISNFAGQDIQFRFWFYSDSDVPQGEGLHIDDFTVNVDENSAYFESFEDSTMAGWESVDETSTNPEWHTDEYGAYGGSGKSWWVGNSEIGSVGGYDDNWYQVLDTPPITLPEGPSVYSVTFDQKRAIEGLCIPSGGNFCPSCETGSSLNQVTDESVDGWDAFNVRISSDGGDTWEVLTNVTPEYNHQQNWAFGWTHGEGCGIPAWGGPELTNPTWEQTEIEIPTEYNGEEIMIRFAFASDGAYSTEYNATTLNTLTGLWIDNINIAGIFTNDGEDETGFQMQSLTPLGGDLWHVDYIGVPPSIPMPQNVSAVASDGSVEVTWDSPSGGIYDNELIDYTNGQFSGPGGIPNAITIDSDQAYLGTMFDMPYGVETATVHSARVHTSDNGSTTLAGFAVVNGAPFPTPVYTRTINTIENAYSDEIVLNWEFQSSFIIALLVTDEIGLSIDETAIPGSNSWSQLGSWSLWEEIVESAPDDAGINDGEFGIQATVTTVGGSVPVFNVYRDPGLNGGSYQLLWNGNGITNTNLTDAIVTNGNQYCYKIASVFDGEISELTDPVCALPESDAVYEIFYDDGSNENAFFVNNNNYLAVKFTPSGYPSALYSSKFYVVNDLGGEVFLYCWDDNGEDGKPGDIIFGPFPFYMDQGWNEFRFANEGIDLPLSDGSIYVGYQQLDVDFSIGVDIESPSNARNSMINIGAGWEELSAYAANGVWMVRAQMDGQNELNNDIENNDILPNEFVLNQNFPNPFNPSTTINFGLLEKSKTTLDVYNILGENVLNVVNENLEPGFYNVKINMDDLASGMYFYRLTAFSRDGQQLYTDMKKMILLQ